MNLDIGGYKRHEHPLPFGLLFVRIVWSPGSRTPKHDHEPMGIGIVRRGRIFEIKGTVFRKYTRWRFFFEAANGTPHIVGNDDPNEEAETWQIWFGPLVMKKFEETEYEERLLRTLAAFS